MSSFVEIKAAIDATATAFEEFKKTNDARVKAIAEGKEALANDLNTKLASIEAVIKESVTKRDALEREVQFQRDRIEELESKRSGQGMSNIEKLRDEYKTAFFSWFRARGQSADDERKMQDLMRRPEFKADVTVGTPGAGGYAVPEQISTAIEKLELKFSPVRSLVKVVRSGTADYKELVSVNTATSGWVGESDARPGTASPSLVEIAPTFGELYAYPQASEWSLDDIFFDVEAWLSEAVAEEFAIAEATAVLTGNGTSKPTGIFNSAPTNETDAAGTRDADEIEFIANVSATNAILPDSVIDLQYRVNSRYRGNGTWAFNSVTAGALRKLKDQDLQYLWQPSLIVGQPDMLLGKPISIWEQMDDPGNNKYPILFGDFRRGYVLADRVGLRVTRDNVTNIGFVKFYIRRREGGIILNKNALKCIKVTNA
jgi:HK97 family phage major capsid protein